MRHQLQPPLPQPIPIILLIIITSIFTSKTHAKSTIEPCNASDSCTSLLSYLLPYASKLSEIAYRFQVNISEILATNYISPISPSLGNQILGAKSLVKVPIPCPCVDGIRRSTSTTYTVRPADTVDSISDGFGGLVSAEQIKSTNGITAETPLTSGQSLVIPLPCTCFNNSNNGVTSVYMSYVVQSGESLSSVGSEFGVTMAELVAVNGLSQPVVDAGDILAVPIPACSSANLNWYNESLIVPNGSYALTASNCIKCSCGPSDLNLQCAISGNIGVSVSCSHLQCKGSKLFIGDVCVKQSATGCNITTCVYRGHNGGKIFSSLSNSSLVSCRDNRCNNAISPRASPSSSSNPIVPFITLSPSPSPSSPMGINSSYNPTSKQHHNMSSAGRILLRKLYISFFIFPLQFALYFIL